MAKFFYGRKRDFYDSRDQVLKMMLFNRASVGELDAFTGLSLPVYDQMTIGSCTANAGVLYRRWLAQKFPQYSSKDQDLSRLFLYYQERLIDGDVSQDDGSTTRSCCQVICKTGICPEADWPYDVATFANPPQASDANDAAPYKAGAYHRVPDASTAISCLVSGYPVLLGVTLYESFEGIESDGVMPMPGSGEQIVGGHEIVIRGYSSSRQAFLVQNSWSADWGWKGCLWMPEAYLDNQDLSQPDCAIIHLGPAW